MVKKLGLSTGKLILSATLILNLLFIFVHAAFPPSVSGAEIDAVGDAIGGVVSENTAFGAFLQRNISNIAHFCEYGALGLQAMIAIILWSRRKALAAALSPMLALAVAFLDESLQIISGRHSSVMDMWVDLLGFAACMLLTLGVFLCVKAIKNKSKQRS